MSCALPEVLCQSVLALNGERSSSVRRRYTDRKVQFNERETTHPSSLPSIRAANGCSEQSVFNSIPLSSVSLEYSKRIVRLTRYPTRMRLESVVAILAIFALPQIVAKPRPQDNQPCRPNTCLPSKPVCPIGQYSPSTGARCWGCCVPVVITPTPTPTFTFPGGISTLTGTRPTPSIPPCPTDRPRVRICTYMR